MSADAIGIAGLFALSLYIAVHFVTLEMRQEGKATREKLQEVSVKLGSISAKLDGVIHYTKVLSDKTQYPPGQSPLDYD